VKSPRIVAVVGALLWGALGSGAAHATTASDLCAPTADPCTWTGNILVDAGSTLDFGNRDLVLAPGSIIRIGVKDTLTIHARRVTIQPGTGGRIRGNSTTGIAPSVDIEALEDIVFERSGTSRGRIDVRSDMSGGSVTLNAGGNVNMGGEILAPGTAVEADGGTVMISAVGNVTLNGNIDVSAGGDGVGGLLTVDAGGTLVAGTQPPEPLLDGRGGLEGGEVDLTAGPLLDVGAKINLNATGPGSDGGFVTFTAAGDVNVRSEVSLDGSGSVDFGGTGGDVSFDAGGTITLNGAFSFAGGFPDGDGGTLDAAAGLDFVQSAIISADSAGTQSFGGTIFIDARRTITLAALFDVHGGDEGGGGFFEAHAGEGISALGEENANGDGGYILLSTLHTTATDQFVSGGVIVGGLLHANAAAAGLGGAINLLACDVTVNASGTLATAGGTDAENLIQGSGAITVRGKMTAPASPAGMNLIQFRDPTMVPSLAGAVVTPAAVVTQDGTLAPCGTLPLAVCGNHVLEVGEACDDGNTTPCDGCSADCRVESCGDGIKECGELCDDHNVVDGDGCDSNCTPTGCGNDVPTPPETCDDGNTTSCDGCSATCRIETCGNGLVECAEACDDGNTGGGDGCSATCTIEPCFTCSGSPSACTPVSGCATTTTTSTSSTTTTTTAPPTTTSSTVTTSTTTTTSPPTTTSTIVATTTTTTTSTTTSLPTTTTSTTSSTTTVSVTTTTSSSTSSTVTTTSTSTSRTSTTAPSTAGTCPGGCDDADPCTDDACVDGTCRNTDVTGPRHATCVCERPRSPACAGDSVSARFTSKVDKACTQLGPASGGAKKAVRAALRSWKAAGKLLNKRAVSRDLSPGCLAALKASVGDALGRTSGLLH
jgi:cysteine-rich repeat protein